MQNEYIRLLETLTADLLDMASDQFSNHGCNDLPKEFFSKWSDTQKQTLARVYWEWCDPKMLEEDPDYCNNVSSIGDSSLMSFLASAMRNRG